MNMQQWKDLLGKQKDATLQARLKDTLEEIKFLESIYETGGENNRYSREFRDAAHTERQELCQLSSALYSMLRERGLNPS